MPSNINNDKFVLASTRHYSLSVDFHRDNIMADDETLEEKFSGDTVVSVDPSQDLLGVPTLADMAFE